MTFQIAEYDCEHWKCIVFREYRASWTATYTLHNENKYIYEEE